MYQFEISNEHGALVRTIGGQYIDASGWPTLDVSTLSTKRQAQYFDRKTAVLLFIAGAPLAEIRQRTQISGKQAYRLIRERCLQPHPDGRVFGWRGLSPWTRIRQYRRNKAVHVDQFGHGAAGAMQAVLDRYPDLRNEFDKLICKELPKGRLTETRHNRKQQLAWFLNKLRALGLEARGEWPFCTATRGYFSVRRYVDQVLAANPKALARATGGSDLVKKLRSGDGAERPVIRFMQRVEMDAHKLDGRFCVSLPLPEGGFQERIIHRLWVVVILEVMSRAVLGYYFSMGREVSTDDVLRAIKRALLPWRARPVNFSEEPYRVGGGLLSVLGEAFSGLCWDETSVDGALAETCQHVRDTLSNVVGSTLLHPKNSFAKRRSKDDRPFIEAFFRNLASGGFQRLSNTTGAKATDRRGQDPDAVALTSTFQVEYAEELLDVLIANYNATEHSGIGYRTPLEYAKFLLQHTEGKLRRVDPKLVAQFFSVKKQCTVKGGAAEGRAPYVTFFYGRYSNEILGARHDLVGRKIWVTSHMEDDARVALASMLDGTHLGVLRAAPPWHVSPHSLMVRAKFASFLP